MIQPSNISIFTVILIICLGSTTVGSPQVETWPVSGGDDTVAVAAAPCAGWCAVGDSFGDEVEVRNTQKRLVRTIRTVEIKALLPWTNFSGGPDGPSGLTWSDSGRVLFILVHDDTSPGDTQGSDAILRYDTSTNQLSVFARLDLWWRGDIWPFLSTVHFCGKLYVGTWKRGIKVYKAECDDISGILLETAPMPDGNFVRGLCIDRETNLLYAASESALFRADLSSLPLTFETVDTTHDYRAITYSGHYGFGAGLYFLNASNQVYHVPPAQARSEQAFAPVLYWTSTMRAFDIAASANGHLLIGLDENAAWIYDGNDE